MSALDKLKELVPLLRDTEYTFSEVSLDWTKDYNWSCCIITGVPAGAVEETGFDTPEEAIEAAINKAYEILRKK